MFFHNFRAKKGEAANVSLSFILKIILYEENLVLKEGHSKRHSISLPK